MNDQSLLVKAKEHQPRMVELRRNFHMHPELGREEERTVGIVQQTLAALGIQTRRVAGTGLVGLLQGKRPGKTVALRADMDALPMDDRKSVTYASQVPGKMHACGHDVHTAGLLGAAMLLSSLRGQFAGNVKFFFQPAEETVGGALPMLQEGVMENPKVDAVFGLHVSPELEAGKIGIYYGKFYAASDMLDVVIRGKSSHGASPQNGIDAIVAASQVICALQSFVSRNVSPLDSAVVTIGKFVGGYQRNIIANQVELSGTIRTLTPETREAAKSRLTKLITGVAEAFGATAEIRYTPGYPCLINDHDMTDFLKNSASALLGRENVKLMPTPKMGVEDFAYFLQHAPGSFYQLGVRNEAKGIIHPVHTNLFDVDEAALAIAAATHAKIALDFLEGEGQCLH